MPCPARALASLASSASTAQRGVYRVACAGAALLVTASGCESSAPRQEGPPTEIAAPSPDASVAPPAPTENEGDGGSPRAGKYGTDCPASAPPSVSPSSPRILILGPHDGAPAAIASDLQGMLSRDPAFSAPAVVALEIEANSSTGPAENGGSSLMNFFYFPEARAQRLARLSEPWSYVVLLERSVVTLVAPEIYFEGARVLGCAARAAGAIPIVLMPASSIPETAAVGSVAYRVANGTEAVVAPAGYASNDARPSTSSVLSSREHAFIAAASLYTTLTQRRAHDTGYHPTEIAAEDATRFATIAFDTTVSEAGKVHYQGAYHGTVETRNVPPGSNLRFMASGTSSEQIWIDRMNAIVPKANLVPHGTLLGPTNASKRFDETSASSAAPYFEAQPYQILFARGYDVDASAVAPSGTQPDLQVQVWDRHFDVDSSDGLSAIATMEYALERTRFEASNRGLAWIPNHLAFAKLKTMRPSVALLGDGTHATFPVGYALATMSIVSRTGAYLSTDGLDPDTRLAAELADETIRQLSTLSASGKVVADDPSTRPAIP